MKAPGRLEEESFLNRPDIFVERKKYTYPLLKGQSNMKTPFTNITIRLFILGSVLFPIGSHACHISTLPHEICHGSIVVVPNGHQGFAEGFNRNNNMVAVHLNRTSDGYGMDLNATYDFRELAFGHGCMKVDRELYCIDDLVQSMSKNWTGKIIALNTFAKTAGVLWTRSSDGYGMDLVKMFAVSDLIVTTPNSIFDSAFRLSFSKQDRTDNFTIRLGNTKQRQSTECDSGRPPRTYTMAGGRSNRQSGNLAVCAVRASADLTVDPEADQPIHMDTLQIEIRK
jgi:hypothetical protein